MSEENKRVLAAWEERMINQLGEEGFKQMKEDTFKRGKYLHSWVETILSGGQEPARLDIEACSFSL
jgi:hypothetical protein